jgi:DHA1 family multidrug resistance protein-like MFS transporter
MYLRLVPEPRRAASTEGGEAAAGPSTIRGLLGRREFLAAMALNFAYLWMIAGVFDTLVPLFGNERLGMSPQGIGFVVALALVGELLVLYPSGWLMDRRGRRFVAVPSMVALAAMGAVLGLAGSAFGYGVLMLVLGLASGVAGMPAGAMLADIAPERSGTAVGIFRFCGDVGLTLGPAVAGLSVRGLGFGPAFAVMGIPLVAAALLAATSPETLTRAPAREAILGISGPQPL